MALAGAATVAGAALALGALDAKPAKTESGGTLIWSIPAAMSLFDPPQSCGWLTKNATHMIFDGLVELELGKPEKGWATLRPALAESWTVSEDGMTYTFNLRKGVKFHDGTPFNAEVAKWNYDRFSNPDAPQYNSVANAYLNFYARWIESSRVVDEHTFEIVLTQPHYEWLQIGQSSCGQPEMISPTAWEIHGDQDIALHPVGTGPFKFVEREIDVMVVLERNDDYYGEPAKLDYMVYRQITDPATRIAALRAGEINMVTEPTWDEIENLVDEGFQLQLQPNVPSVWYAAFNMQHPDLQDVRVRKAINMAIDREGVAREVLRGTGKAEHGMLSAGTFAYDPDYDPCPYDPDGAKALLAEAGYADGLELTFEIFDYGWNEAWEKWMQRDLKKVGIDLKLEKLEWMTYLGKWLQGMPETVAMNSMGWGWSVPYWREQGAGPRPRGGADAPRRHPRARGQALRLPAPVLGRHAPARADRHRHRLRAGHPHRRRADDRARRHHPGPDPAAVVRHPEEARQRHDPYHPRSRRGLGHGRRGAGDVFRSDGRVRRREDDLPKPPAPLHPGAAGFDHQAGRLARIRAALDLRPPADPHRPAHRLPLPHPLPAPDARMLRSAPRAQGSKTWPPGGVLLALKAHVSSPPRSLLLSLMPGLDPGISISPPYSWTGSHLSLG